jgi:PII-like signaling protein
MEVLFIMLLNGKMLKIYIDETQKYKGKRLYDLIISKLKEAGVSTAIVYRSIEGFGEDRVIHTAHIVDLAVDLPVIIEAIGDDETIAGALDAISPLIERGLLLTIDVSMKQIK